ncbi:uncharacterized protein LOC123520860 isoform X2 [Portunus trituberculatus]|uniref:uncharacterized protein LOC123520860 isoform X2 n=1 Tax=Portunus trituberculatus TaxID=210409 RepID=UPI001E1CF94F|nr:uncharacterized protein LOC123520860 isoform X2 [Portunus trituberculatus]
MHLSQILWCVALVFVAAVMAAKRDGKNRDPVELSRLHLPKELKGGDSLPWKTKVTHAWTGLPAQIALEVKGVLGTGSLHLAGGDGTFVTFLAYGHHIQAAGSLPVDHRDRERNMEQITQQKGDNNNGTGFGNRPGHTRWPPTSQEFQFSSHGDTTRPHTPQAVCPLFAPADRNYGAAPKTPVYGLACSEGRGGLILEATHVYTDPGKYQVDAHFLDDLLGVVTGRWEAQVEVEELMQVTLGPSQALPLQDGRAVASATLSLTPSAESPPLPCPEGLISWAWDFGDGTGEEGGGECTSEEREKKEERMSRERKRGKGKDSDFLRNAQKRRENFAGLEESGGEGKKEVESTDKRTGEERKAEEGLKDQKKDSPDSTAPSFTYFTSSLSTSSATTTTTTSSSSTSISTSTNADDEPPFTTTSTSITVHHTYTAPGTFNMSVVLLCGCRGVARRDVGRAFTVAVPIGDVQISASETHLLLLQGDRGHPRATEEVVMTVKVANGSLLHLVTLHTDDGTQVLLQPTLTHPEGPWLAEAKHKYQLPGEYRPWVEVSNPVGEGRAALHTVIKVDQPPNTVVLVPEEYVSAVGKEVVFMAKVLGASSGLHYDWVLPGGEILQDQGPVVARTYEAPLQDTVSVSVYHDAHARTPSLPRPQASTQVTVEAPLTAVQLLVDGKDTNIILPKNKNASLKAVVSPLGAQRTTEFFFSVYEYWISTDEIYLLFPTPGEVTLQVWVKNKISRVESQEVRVLVVEEIGNVRGLADHDSVLVYEARNYTVLVGRGTNITYTWDFGGSFLQPVNTTVPTKTHTYLLPGTYTLTVSLTTPLGDLHVLTSKVFVLKSGKCDTPKVLQFYPRDTSAKREFDGTQEILVEPSLLRNCPLGSGPEYRWTIWNKDGQEVPLSSTRLDTPSLLVHPVYDHDWPDWLRTDIAKRILGLAVSLPQEEEQGLMMGVLAPRSLEDGEYTTQLTVKERGTIVQASYNTTFSVVATRLRVTFVDGTEREVDRDANVTLRVEVTSPSPNFTVSFRCSPLDAPSASCFTEANQLSSFPTSTNEGENLFSRLQHLWELLHNTSSSDSSSSSSSSSDKNLKNNPFTSSHFSLPFNKIFSPFHMYDDSHFLHKVFNTSQHYIVSLTFPASTLVSTHKRFKFSASIKKDPKHRVEASQVVSISSPRDNIGIQTCLGSQFPFGALRRMVFESECMSCSPEELAVLRYTWRLKMLVNEQYAPMLNSEQQTAASEAEVTLQRILRQTEVDESFFSRPSDYLRVYNKSALQERPTQTAPEEDSNPNLAFPTPSLSTHDLQNLPEIIAPEILHQVAEIYHRWGRPSAASLGIATALRKNPTSDINQVLDQGNPRGKVTVANINPLQAAVDLSRPNNDLAREGVRISRSAPAATHHAQRRQMRESDRTSSSQTNMHRKVVGRHSGEAAQRPVTDEAAPPAPASPTAPATAFIKVTLDNHHSHLVHRAVHFPPQGIEGEKVKDPTALSPTEGWLSGPSHPITAAPEAEHQAGHTNPDYPHRTKRNSPAEKVAVEDLWLATAQRVDHGESRRSGVKWEAMGKVFDGEKAVRQHQVILSKGKVQENEYLKILEEEEEEEKEEVEEKENRLWWANDGDHRVRENSHDGGSDRKEERRPMTEAGTGGVAENARRGLEEDGKHTTVKPPLDAQFGMRKTAATQAKASEARPRRAAIRQEASPLDSAVPIEVDALTKAAVKREGHFLEIDK